MGVQEFLSAGLVSLNESPSQKEGKLVRISSRGITCCRLNESPSQKEGKWVSRSSCLLGWSASMKALPRRKGNW